MSQAVIASLYATKNQPMEDITVVDLDSVKLKRLEKTYGVKTTMSALVGATGADVILLATKPQNITTVAKELQSLDFRDKDAVLVSVMAGCSVRVLEDAFPTCNNFVRSMPNTPSAVLEGITLWYPSSENITRTHLNNVQLLLGSFGEEIMVNDESFLDMATAISGSGPAYVFLMAECLIDAGVHLGFPRGIAERLALSTIRGSTSYAMQSPESLSELRYKVTSPGGTTASALYELEKGRFRTVITDAVWAALRRARELGDQNPNVGPGRTTFFLDPRDYEKVDKK
jgi:pyrroline-5-carboxylate reductase